MVIEAGFALLLVLGPTPARLICCKKSRFLFQPSASNKLVHFGSTIVLDKTNKLFEHLVECQKKLSPGLHLSVELARRVPPCTIRQIWASVVARLPLLLPAFL